MSYQPDVISHLAHVQAIPLSIRLLALECLTALVARRDGSALGTEARLSCVLTEVGVGKGLYMGVLPTLLRYALAAITATATATQTNNFDMVQGNIQYMPGTPKEVMEGNDPPISPPVPEFIMDIPNILAALALTEDGAKAVKEANPFPALCKLFYSPDYAHAQESVFVE
jgi:hypothetical protein